MNEISRNWQFYAGMVGVLGSVITVIIYGKIKGANSLNWKSCSVILAIFLIPTLILPMWFDPAYSIFERIGITILLISFAAARYYVTTKGQEAAMALRDSDRTQNEKRL